MVRYLASITLTGYEYGVSMVFMGRPKKEGTAYERRRAGALARRDLQLADHHFRLVPDEHGRTLLECEACKRCWHWPIAASYRMDHYALCSGARPWIPPAHWDDLPFPVAPGSPLPTDPLPQPVPLPLRYVPWPDVGTSHDSHAE